MAGYRQSSVQHPFDGHPRAIVLCESASQPIMETDGQHFLRWDLPRLRHLLESFHSADDVVMVSAFLQDARSLHASTIRHLEEIKEVIGHCVKEIKIIPRVCSLNSDEVMVIPVSDAGASLCAFSQDYSISASLNSGPHEHYQFLWDFALHMLGIAQYHEGKPDVDVADLDSSFDAGVRSDYEEILYVDRYHRDGPQPHERPLLGHRVRAYLTRQLATLPTP